MINEVRGTRFARAWFGAARENLRGDGFNIRGFVRVKELECALGGCVLSGRGDITHAGGQPHAAESQQEPAMRT